MALVRELPEMSERQYGVATAQTKLDCVQIDGLVVLKIIKHCRSQVCLLFCAHWLLPVNIRSRDEGNPTHPAVSGQLLGMDITLGGVTTLEVTSCFPMPPQTDAEDAEEGKCDMFPQVRTNAYKL